MKTTINVNEVSANGANPEMEKALKEITDLKSKLKEYENKLLYTSQNSMNNSKEENKDMTNQSMDQSSDKLNTSQQSQLHQQNSEYTIMFLRE